MHCHRRTPRSSFASLETHQLFFAASERKNPITNKQTIRCRRVPNYQFLMLVNKESTDGRGISRRQLRLLLLLLCLQWQLTTKAFRCRRRCCCKHSAVVITGCRRVTSKLGIVRSCRNRLVGVVVVSRLERSSDCCCCRVGEDSWVYGVVVVIVAVVNFLLVSSNKEREREREITVVFCYELELVFQRQRRTSETKAVGISPSTACMGTSNRDAQLAHANATFSRSDRVIGTPDTEN
jgi:hypothetical protein